MIRDGPPNTTLSDVNTRPPWHQPLNDKPTPIRVVSVVGTRPNFMKVLPVAAELERRKETFDHSLVHTGQHYDDEMSNVFFVELQGRAPDHFLEVGSGSHAVQTARVMERLEPLLVDLNPDVLLVPGDVNSTLGAALVGSKLGIAVAHIEAGLRSYDRSMPEELNRVLVDAISKLLFTHSPEAEPNLLREGRPAEDIHYVGNTMIDTLVRVRGAIESADAPRRFGLTAKRYLLVTLHRPALVDSVVLEGVWSALCNVASDLTVVFPAHPRTQIGIERLEMGPPPDQLIVVPPLGYLDFMSLMTHAGAVLTDSGGVQEETTFLGVPCFTLRDNTERPVTIELGTNRLLGLDPSRIRGIPRAIARGGGNGSIPPLWDGRAAVRIANILAGFK